MKIAINTCFSAFTLSKEAYEYLGLEWDNYGTEYEEDRSNPLLIECIKQLGERANGKQAKIKIVEIPDDIEWYISNYDGIEVIHEEHRTWK